MGPLVYMIISGLGIPKNAEKDELVYLYDIFPTLEDKRMGEWWNGGMGESDQMLPALFS